jgi:hypothetical protein
MSLMLFLFLRNERLVIGSSANTIPKKMRQQPNSAFEERRSCAQKYPAIAANTGSIAKIKATLVADVYF